jgi:hypothetical protein
VSEIADSRLQIADYCREIETYSVPKERRPPDPRRRPVVRARVGVGGAGRAAEDRVAGIDRYFERYYRKGPRRRPVKIDFCEADVLDVFDEWRGAGYRRAAGPSVVSRKSIRRQRHRVAAGASRARRAAACRRRARRVAGAEFRLR